MNLSINTNLASMKSQRALWNTNYASQSVVKKLSSGVRINSAADDAANLSLSKKLNSQSSGLDVASRNVQTALTKMQTFDGYFSTMYDGLHRLRDLATQAANGSYSENEREMLNKEAQEVISEVYTSSKQANSEIKLEANEFDQKVTQLSDSEIVSAGYDEDHTIRTAQEFVDKITGNEDQNFILADNIDMSQLGTLSTAAITATFEGELDGNGYAIKNLSIKNTTGDVGLFTEIDGGKVKNLALKDFNISTTGNAAGHLSSVISNNTQILNSYSSGNISGATSTGGLIGESYDSEILNSYSKANVIGNDNAGGLIGSTQSSEVRNSFSLGNVKGNNYVGGLIGITFDSDEIIQSYATGDISGAQYVGGLIGDADNILIEESYATGDVLASGNRAGGLLGALAGEVFNSYATGNVTGNNNTGGAVGVAQAGSTIWRSFAIGNVSGAELTGGFIGNNGGTVDNSFASGDVYGSGTTGGFAGLNANNITSSYTTSKVTGDSTKGAFAGRNLGGTVDNNSYYNTDINKGMSAVGVNPGTFNAQGVDSTTYQAELNTEISSWGTEWNTSTEMPTLNSTNPLGKELSVVSAGKLTIQTGSEADSSGYLDISELAVGFGNMLEFDLTNTKDTGGIIARIDSAIKYMGEKSASLGANMNSLEEVLESNSNRSIRTKNSNSTIRDTDMAKEAATMVKQQILQQSSTTLLQQAQQLQAQSVLTFY